MPTCIECRFYDDADADFLTKEKDICISCGPHILVEFGVSDKLGKYVNVHIKNLLDYSGDDDATFYSESKHSYKKDAIDYAKQAADKNQRNFIILYRGISPWLADKELSI
ncbi:hypothetical protein [Paenibacillus sp. PDC88]|uniref:TFIIB-type zinc ribbon-containing protein n=1 Tax=Paenibacillus provencensis TaxID=441151 RepID=A0ABW3PZE8_9BACL|nr:hypothetical protein [Paenibacillus sp. PDC88]SDX63778.1 hypothetical protein SAMN05518848_110113 [Paenibacillus sp. PDC88]